jgi:hypothetical protein
MLLPLLLLHHQPRAGKPKLAAERVAPTAGEEETRQK